MKFCVWVVVDDWCMSVCSMTQSKVTVKVTSLWKSEIWPFSTAISFPFTIGAVKWPRIRKLGGNTYSLSGPDFLFLS